MLRIIQLSDCHLPARRGQLYRGRDPYAAIDELLPAIAAWRPDVLLATGDLGEDASSTAYAWLASRLASLAVPVLAIPGNHDHAGRIREHFAASAVDAPLVFDTHGWRLIMLNSAPFGQIPGSFDDRQLQLLASSVAECDVPVLVALHHQPVPVGSPWIDKYPLLQAQHFWQAIGVGGQVKVVCWGHIHQPFTQQVDGILALGSPSSVSNTLPGSRRFSDDGRGGLCRWLELAADGSVNTGLLGPAGLLEAV
jgi:Icc protein